MKDYLAKDEYGNVYGTLCHNTKYYKQQNRNRRCTFGLADTGWSINIVVNIQREIEILVYKTLKTLGHSFYNV